MIPLLHDFTDATVLVVGGGPVGARKARRFAREAEVVVVSPEFSDADFGDVQLVRTALEADPVAVGEWLERLSPALVVAATDDETVNDAVVTAARERGTLVNRADRAGDREPGSVVVPATIREGPVVVSVSSGGRAPVLSKYLRQDLEGDLEGAGEMAELLAALRAELKSQEVPPARRREIVTEVVNAPDIWTGLRTGTANARQVIEDVLAEEGSTGGGVS